MVSRRPLRLSTRVTLFFGAVTLLAGLTLTFTTYVFVQRSLLDQRYTTATSTAIEHARTINDALTVDPRNPSDALLDLDFETNTCAVLVTSEGDIPSCTGRWDADVFPTELTTALSKHESGTQQFTLSDGEPYLGVGVYLAGFNMGYLEASPLATTERTLRILGWSMIIGTALTTLLATFFGWSTSRRLLRPVSRVADAAGQIASGGLDARLVDERDPDLNRLVGSFNHMADAVQDRIGREQRFASDVSHELRSPITALSAAVEVLDARRTDLPDRTQQALDVVVSQVRRFDSMVIDLLELARIDAGATDVNLDEVDFGELCTRVASKYGYTSLPVEVERRARRRGRVDRVRFERILSNLLDNAKHHAGEPDRISIEAAPIRRHVDIVVEDSGPGVEPSERTRIFERYARGSTARHRVGTGLGLALVAEHAQSMGGKAWVEDRPGGGSRFIVRLPSNGVGERGPKVPG